MANIDRKMVTIRKIEDLLPIPGANKIELAIIDGWQCVVKKGMHYVHEQVLYFEIDSMMPADDERFKFLKDTKRIGSVRRPVLRTIKLRGQISQGLVMPLNDFPEIQNRPTKLSKLFKNKYFLEQYTIKEVLDQNHDLDKLLRIEKYDEDVDYSDPTPARHKSKLQGWIYRAKKALGIGKVKAEYHAKKNKTFPKFIPRTDEPRVQNMFNSLRSKANLDVEWEETVKLDGKSATFWYYDEKFGFASRNQTLSIGCCPTEFSDVILKLKLNEHLPAFCRSISRNLAFQGELIGPGIGGNYEQVKENEFYLFNIYDIDAQSPLLPDTRREMYDKYREFSSTNLKHVPIRGRKTLRPYSTIEAMMENANVPSINVAEAEGVVWQRVDKDESFKIISNQYLLRKK